MYMEERSKRWISTMESVEIKDPKTFDTYLLDRHPPKTQWAFVGRGFLYSDIQFKPSSLIESRGRKIIPAFTLDPFFIPTA